MPSVFGPSAWPSVKSTVEASRSSGLYAKGGTAGTSSAFFSSSIARMFGNAASTTVKPLSSRLFLRSIARIATSTALPAALVASTLPFRSATERMPLSFLTMNSLE